MVTNRDKITNEKLAKMILEGSKNPCKYCILKSGCSGDIKSSCIQNIKSWLSQEVKNDK